MPSREARAIALAAGLATSTGCPEPVAPQPRTPPESPPAEVPVRDTLVIAAAAEPRDLLSPLSQSAIEMQIGDLVGLSLLAPDFDCGLQFSARLARSWTWSDDGRSLSVELSSAFRWDDGDPVDADDVVLAFALALDPEVQSPRAAMLAGLDPDFRPKRIDATHLEFRWLEAREPTAALAAIGSLPVVPSHLLREADRGSLRANPLDTQKPRAAGPWAVAEWRSGEKLVLEPNPNWPGEQPQLRRTIFRSLPDYAARLAELEVGGVDVMDGVAVGDAERLAREHPELRLHRRGWRGEDVLVWNNRAPGTPPDPPADGRRHKPQKPAAHPLFGDREVRRALTTALDIDRLIQDLLTTSAGEVYGKRAVGTISPELCHAHDDGLARLPHDVEAAKASLARRGWKDANGDGVLEKSGVSFRFSLLVAAGSPRRQAGADAIAAQLGALGVAATVETLEAGPLADRLRAHDFDAALTGWTASLSPQGSNWLSDSELNWAGYANPKVDAIVARASAATAPDEANAAWRELQALVYADQPWTFLYWVDEIVAVHERFEGASVDLLAPGRKLENWTVAQDKVKYPL